jgi:Type II secretory pathway, ATPase PulE/Tfp pilus assembly pathway, ATPase PilB
MFKLIMSIFNKKKPVTANTSKGRQNKIATKKKTTSLPIENTISKPQIRAGKSKEELTIRRIEFIPEFKEILTKDGGEISLSNEHKKDYIALLVNADLKIINIFCSTEASSQTGIDHNFVSLRERCKAKGFTIEKQYYAPRQIISLLYEKESKEKNLEDEVKNAEGLQADFDMILMDALKKGVSDIHIEVRRDAAIVRYRKDGSLRLIHEWGVSYARQMAVVIYQVIAEEKDVTFVETQQQSAIIDRQIEDQRIRVRLNTMPAYPDGFDVVMRVLRMGASNTKKTLSGLGYSKQEIKDINISVSKPVGVTIIAGTTGSGKSTSLTTMISDKIERHTDESGCRIKVITVEDPPEYQINHATQCPVVRSRNGKDGKNPFAEAIKAAMRSDPDVLMVGEVRDEDSAELLVHAVQSGHQAFTTVHAPSAIGIVARLRSLGVKNDVLGSNDFIAGLIYQALIPVSCPHCRLKMKEYIDKNKNDERAIELLERIEKVTTEEERNNIRFVNQNGCEHCNNGISGRTVVAEVILPDHQMISYFAEGRDTLAWHYYRQNGGKSVLSHGIDKMKDGLCDPMEIEHKLGMLTRDLSYSFAEKTVETSENNNFQHANKDGLCNESVELNLSEINLESALLKGEKKEPGQITHIDFTKPNKE